jgi:predicted GIY-YIG superfamily endonuclease
VKNMSETPWFCYLLQSEDKQRTYIGATVNPDRRLRQHNGEICGGACATKGRSWKRVALMKGFPNEVAALQFEWAWKFHARKHGSGLKARFQGLADLLKKPKATSKAVPFSEWSTGLPTLHLEELEYQTLISELGLVAVSSSALTVSLTTGLTSTLGNAEGEAPL